MAPAATATAGRCLPLVHRASWLFLIALAFAWPRGARAQDAGIDAAASAGYVESPRGARAQDAGIDAAASAGYVDFTDDEGLAGGEELSSPSLQPLEHDSLLPDRFRGPIDAGPPPPGPAAPRGRGCAGCGAAGEASLPWLVVAVAIALRRRRTRRFLHDT